MPPPEGGPQTRNVPVIFISALQETQDKVSSFHAGGVEAPFQEDRADIALACGIPTRMMASYFALHGSRCLDIECEGYILAAGCNDMLVKPLEEEGLYALMARLARDGVGRGLPAG
jgi:CheY-like chemotaxis protein